MDQKQSEGALHWLIRNGGSALIDYRAYPPRGRERGALSYRLGEADNVELSEQVEEI